MLGSPEAASAVTDRYIPARKCLKRDSLFKSEDCEMDEEGENCNTEG